jgi:hypothetical protein
MHWVRLTPATRIAIGVTIGAVAVIVLGAIA